MKIVASSDWHVDSTMAGTWDPKAGINSNWIESFARIDDLVDVCNEEKADLLLVSGDIFHTGRPTAEAVQRLKDSLSRLRKVRGKYVTKIVATNGNHDQASVIGHHRTPIEAYLGDQPYFHHVSGGAEVIDFNGLSLALVPWYRVAGAKTLEQTSSVMRDDINRLADGVANIGNPSILAGHVVVSEATFDSGMRSSEMVMSTSVLEATVKTQQLEDGPWSRYCLGHIHKRQQLGERGGYVGSTYKVSFAERNEAKGCEVIDIDDQTGVATHRFHQFRVRELIQLDMSVDSSSLQDLEEFIRERDLLRLVYPSDVSPSKKVQQTINSFKKRGVEVQIRHLPRERRVVSSKGISIDTDPVQAMEMYAQRHFPADEKRMKECVDIFKEIHQDA